MNILEAHLFVIASANEMAEHGPDRCRAYGRLGLAFMQGDGLNLYLAKSLVRECR